MNTKNTVFSRLFDADKHRELKLKAVKKVSLSIVDDLNSLIQQAETYSDVIDLDTAIIDSKLVIDAYNTLNSIAEKYYNEFEVINNWYSELEIKEQDLSNKMAEYENLAEELGIDPNQLEAYSYADSLIGIIDEELNRYKDNNSSIEEALDISTNRII